MKLNGKHRTRALVTDAAVVLACAVAVILIVPSYAFAYVDPSVITYTIQALAGVMVALSAVFGVAMRRTRRIIMNALNIDENVRKEVEPDAHRVGSDGVIVQNACAAAGAQAPSNTANPSADASGKKTATKRRAADAGNRPSWKRRLVLSLIVVGFCGFTLGVVAPFETVAGNTTSLLFSLSDIWLPVSAAVLVAVLALSLIVSVIPGRAFTLVLTLLFCGGLCCYVQAMFLNSGLPSADGSAVDFWNDHFDMIVVSTVAWVILLTVPTIVGQFNRLRTQVIVAGISVCLMLVQGVGVASLFLSQDDGETGSRVVQTTEEGLFEVSETENTIVFILDHFDTRLFDELLAQDPDLLEGIPGFVYYRNSLGTMLPTRFSLPYLLTQEEPLLDEPITSYYTDRFTRSTFLEELGSGNCSIGIYAADIGLSRLPYEEQESEIARHTVNIHGVDRISINEVGVLTALAKCALYRDMPWILKWRFWFYTDEVNIKAVGYDPDASPSETVYLLDDPRYLERLQNIGLSFEESDGGAFRMIHLSGAHAPYSMDEQGRYVGVDASSEAAQALGSLHIVETYLQQLMDLGVYDSSTVIIMSDHGRWEGSGELPTDVSSPIMLMKAAGAGSGAEGSAHALRVSQAPVSHANFHATVLDAMGIDGTDYGLTISELGSLESYGADDPSLPTTPRTTFMVTHDAYGIVDLLEYEVTGDALDFANWRFTGETWQVDEWNTGL